MWPIKSISSTTINAHGKGDQEEGSCSPPHRPPACGVLGEGLGVGAGHEVRLFPFGRLSSALIGFLCRFALIYLLLMAPWPGLKEGYANLYRAGAQWVFGEFGEKGIVLFKPYSQAGELVHDTRILLINREQSDPENKQAPAGPVRTNSRYHGYMLTVFLSALILASPIPSTLRQAQGTASSGHRPWSRRAWALLWGLILIHAFIAFKLTILILYYYNVYQPLGLFLLTPFWKSLLDATYDLFVARFNTSFIIAIFVWMLVTFRHEDWELRGSMSS